MSELKIWKGTLDESTLYLDLEPRGSDSVALLVRDAAGHQKACLLYVNKNGIQRLPALNGKLGFEMADGGRIALWNDPITKELLKLKKGNCPHCGHGGCD